MDMTNAVSPADDAAVRTLLAAYCQRVDDRKTDELVELFSPDAVVVLGGREHAGREALHKLFGSLAGNAGKHLTTNSIISAESGTRFSSVSDFAFLRKGDDGTWGLAVIGRYVDTIERKGSDYLIARREMVFN